MKILIIGGTGFIGRELSSFLQEMGDEVYIASRSPEKVKAPYSAIRWPLVDRELPQVEGVINLAGETINQRWTKGAKERILASRVETTRRLVSYIREGVLKPEVVINGSAVGFYGTKAMDSLTEDSPPGDDFLAEVTKAWEQEAEWLDSLDVRLVKARIGLVLGVTGGALPRMLLPYKLFVGGKLGTGRQWVSWIHMRDLVRLFAYCLRNTELKGAVNFTAPHPVTMDTLGKTIAKLLDRPHWLSAPSWAIRFILGEMSDLILKGQQVIPEKALAAGFKFEYPELEQALIDILGKK